MRFWIVVVSVLLAAGCTGGSPPPPQAGVDATAVWRAFVACARANGKPSWPDPAVDTNTGRATFPQSAGFDPKQDFEVVREACGRELDSLPPQANPLARPVVSPSEIQLKLQYSQCMREHGVPEWQDPAADGYYRGGEIPGYNTDPVVTGRVNAARDACGSIIGR